MDKKQIKKEIEKKVDKWSGILFINSFVLLSAALIFFTNGSSVNIELLIVSILSIINFFGYIKFSIYAYDIIEKRYDEFLKREEYRKNQTLKDKILDFLTLMIFIGPILALFIVITILVAPLDKAITIIMLLIFMITFAFI
jgi:hypothetical protein